VDYPLVGCLQAVFPVLQVFKQPRKEISIKLLTDPDAHMYVFLVELLLPLASHEIL
jgi:hypothetical protein